MHSLEELEQSEPSAACADWEVESANARMQICLSSGGQWVEWIQKTRLSGIGPEIRKGCYFPSTGTDTPTGLRNERECTADPI